MLLFDRWELAVLGAGVVLLGFALLWLTELRSDDASLVDMGWALALGGLAGLYGLLGQGDATRRVWLAVLTGAWSLRLATHIYLRHRGGPEDGRYRALRSDWGEKAHRNFFWLYQAQGILAVVLSTPFLLIAFNPDESLAGLEILGVGLALFGLVMESVADAQLGRHRANPKRRGQTCREGLWRYSRHPNYFFEWLIWVGFGMASLAAPFGFIGLLSPVAMLWLILKVTGIPPAEKSSLESRGEDYRRYQASTSAFVPWFPKSETSR